MRMVEGGKFETHGLQSGTEGRDCFTYSCRDRVFGALSHSLTVGCGMENLSVGGGMAGARTCRDIP